MTRPHGARPTRGRLLAVLSVAALAHAAAAHELVVPETVPADASGHFEVVARFEIGPGDERLEIFQMVGDRNVAVGVVADYECIALFPEGSVVELDLPSLLVDPLLPGVVQTTVVTCGVSGEQTVWQDQTVVVPHEPTRPGHVWWIDSAGVYRAGLDGSDPREIVAPDLALAGGSVTVDPLGGRIYWSSWEQALFAGVIRRARIHEGVPEIFTFGGKGGLAGVAADVARRELYVVDPSDCIPGCASISRIKLDGSSGETLIFLDAPEAIAVSGGLDRMCWADTFHQAIECSDLDGGGRFTLVRRVLARGLAIDGEAATLYWSQDDPPRIRRVGLDGGAPEDVVARGLVQPHGVAFDPVARKVYWSDAATGKLQRADSEGILVEDLVVDLVQPTGVALDWGQADLRLTLDDAVVQWSAIPGALRFDLVRGDLGDLRSSGGDYSATRIGCVADDVGGTSAGFTDEPTHGEGIFLLLRAVSLAGNETFDSLGSGQAGARDAEIAGSAGSCP